MLGLIVLLTYILLVRAFRSAVAAAQGRRAEPHLGGRDLRRHGDVLAVRLGVEAIFGIKATGAITFWLPADGVRVPVRPVHGLRGVHPRPGCGRSTTRRNRPTWPSYGAWPDRTARHQRRAGAVPRVRLAWRAAPQTDIKLFATALGFGILLDATVVRALLVPALVSLFGRWNWYLPDWVAKVLRVPPSKAHPEPAREIALAHLVPPPRRRARLRRAGAGTGAVRGSRAGSARAPRRQLIGRRPVSSPRASTSGTDTAGSHRARRADRHDIGSGRIRARVRWSECVKADRVGAWTPTPVKWRTKASACPAE